MSWAGSRSRYADLQDNEDGRQVKRYKKKALRRKLRPQQDLPPSPGPPPPPPPPPHHRLRFISSV
ncbi:hypothetical protein BDZ91DRAFT_797504 [Kalaharituber pfeilii]|nr:hypothetical protein BDZ91DRAFT_797504 [Kalaharituber pfeilii]